MIKGAKKFLTFALALSLVIPGVGDPLVCRAEASSTSTESTSTGSTEAQKTETSKTETSKTETSKTDTGNTETSKTETGKTETGNTETGNTETGKTDNTENTESKKVLGALKTLSVKSVSAPSFTAPDGFTQAYGAAVTYTDTNSWDDKGEIQLGISQDTPVKSGATLELDLLIPGSEISYNGEIKVQAAARLGSNWDWKEATSIPAIKSSDFTSYDGYYKTHVEFTFGDNVESDKLSNMTIKIVGANCDYSGSIYYGNVVFTDGTSGEESHDADPLFTKADMFALTSSGVTFKKEADWEDHDYISQTDLSTPLNIKEGSYVTVDMLIPEGMTYEGGLKFQCALKVGDKWEWTSSSTYPEVKSTEFDDSAVSGYRKASLRFTFGSDIEAGEIHSICLKAAGDFCDYSGMIYFENLALYDAAASDDNPVQTDPAVIDDFEADTTDWINGGNYKYDTSASKVISLEQIGGSQALKVDLDYTGKGAETWSEAKIEKTLTTPMDISAYNCLTMDVYYEQGFSGNSIKVFSDGIWDGEAKLEEKGKLDNGIIHAVATLKFSNTDTKLSKITIGIVGKSTTYKGAVYLDNIKVSQYDGESVYVKITSTPGAGTKANTSNMPSNVTLADSDASAETARLYSYLYSLKSADQVLFGHQYDSTKHVNTKADDGDTKDVTGSYSGIYGIDSLALSGAELGLSGSAAIDKAVSESKKAADGGSIITLSAHMPNFSNSKVVKNDDGTYDFSSCDFSESKDLTGSCADQVLPGGKYNDAFNAYLDMIADYAKDLQSSGVPVIFRPFHENTGGWFWWGTCTSKETFISLYRYTVDYMRGQGVHNMLYVYSPCGPVSSESEYLSRYPGDDYVDILAFDYYDDYNSYPAESDGSFFTGLDDTCKVVSSVASGKGKIAAISETGARVEKEDGSDNEGLLVSGNPITSAKTGTNWYSKICDIAKDNDMPYYLVWANFSDTNFYVPYKYDETHGQEMINDFIDFYNADDSIFGNGTDFYSLSNTVSVDHSSDASGYIIAPLSDSVLKDEFNVRVNVTNGTDVKVLLKNSDNGKTLKLSPVRDGSSNDYKISVSKSELAQLGETENGTMTLSNGSDELCTVKNLCFNKDRDTASADVLDDFDYYKGNDELLQNAYSGNHAGGCSSEMKLTDKEKADGTYGAAFNYVLKTTGSEVWAGQTKKFDGKDLSGYNALQLWVKGDGKGQKLVIQLVDGSGEEFEVYLTDFVKDTKSAYITIPFSKFVGKNSGTLDPSKITKFGIWCNSIFANTDEWPVDSTIYFDAVKGVNVSATALTKVNEAGYIVSDDSNPYPESGSGTGTGSGTSSGTASNSSSGSSSSDSSSSGDSGSSSTSSKATVSAKTGTVPTAGIVASAGAGNSVKVLGASRNSKQSKNAGSTSKGNKTASTSKDDSKKYNVSDNDDSADENNTTKIADASVPAASGIETGSAESTAAETADAQNTESKNESAIIIIVVILAGAAAVGFTAVNWKRKNGKK